MTLKNTVTLQPGTYFITGGDLKVNADGNVTIARSDIYGGSVVPFVPFTRLDGEVIKGTHNAVVDKVR